jgi:hypothetical protein
LKFVEDALESVGEDHPMTPRIYVAIGIGYSNKAMEMRLQADRQQLHKKALSSFNRSDS